SGRPALLVESGDRPTPGAMLIRERESSSGGLHLEERPRPGDDRIGSRLLADRGQPRHGQSFVAPGDLSWTAVEPASPHVDLDRLDSDHGHSGLLRGGDRLARVRLRGTSATGTSVRFWRHAASNTCSMSSDVEAILGEGCVILRVTIVGLAVGSTAVVRLDASRLERAHRVVLERGRESRSDQARPGDRPLAEPMADLVGRLHGPPPTRILEPEQGELFALAETAGRHPEEPDPHAADLRPREVKRRPEDRL